MAAPPDPDNVVVTTPPISEAGIALPTPVPVNWGGIDKVAVLGFAAASLAYMLPDSPPCLEYCPLSRFALEPPDVKSPVVSEP